MSQIKLEAPFTSFRGKICKHSDIIFKEMYGETFTSQICKATIERIKDPNMMVQDQMDFRSQNKYKTLYQYVWHLMRAEIEGQE